MAATKKKAAKRKPRAKSKAKSSPSPAPVKAPAQVARIVGPYPVYDKGELIATGYINLTIGAVVLPGGMYMKNACGDLVVAWLDGNVIRLAD